jgi:hypothetical protein
VIAERSQRYKKQNDEIWPWALQQSLNRGVCLAAIDNNNVTNITKAVPRPCFRLSPGCWADSSA